MIYSKEGLPKGEHTIKIVTKEPVSFPGRQNSNAARAAGVPLDGFVVLDGNTGGDVMLIINNKWNHTKMGLGNYMKDPILIGSEYRDKVIIRLADADDVRK